MRAAVVLLVLSVQVLTALGQQQSTATIEGNIIEQVKRPGADQQASFQCIVKNKRNNKIYWTRIRTVNNQTQEKTIALETEIFGPANDDKYQVFYVNNATAGYTNSTLLVRRLEMQDGGWYQCKVIINGLPESQYPRIKGKLTLVTAPKITVDNNNVQESVGANVTLRCTVTGNPPPRIEWSRTDGQTIRIPGNPTKVIGETLFISNLQMNDSGSYQCSAKGEATKGQDAAEAKGIVSLNVFSIPFAKAVHTTKFQQVGRDHEVELECMVQGYPLPNVNWYKEEKAKQGIKENQDPLSEGEKYIITESQWRDSSTKIFARLTIRAINSNDFGRYKCVGVNQQNQKNMNGAWVYFEESDQCQGRLCPNIGGVLGVGGASTAVSSLVCLGAMLFVSLALKYHL